MHWILQNNLFNETAYETLLDLLVRYNISHSIHKVVPFVGELIPDPAIEHNNVICMGSYSLRHVAKRCGWYPGVFDIEALDFTIQRDHWGTHMLNYDSVVVPFGEANFDEPEVFIRPIQDSKVFAGRLITKEEFDDWQNRVVVLEEDYGDSLNKNTLIQVVPPKLIYTEYRFWIVRGDIVTSSLYKRGTRVVYNNDVPHSVSEYVNDRVKEWQPNEAFVIDVCDTPDGMKVVEINTLNSCGFYAADISKLITSLEDAFTE